MIIKLVSPIKMSMEIGDESYPVSSSTTNYIKDIQAVLYNHMVGDDEDFLCKGLAAYFDEGSLLERYVKTAVVSVKEIKGDIMAVCHCVVPDNVGKDNKLLERIVDDLKEEISGQYADGWGEGFEQRPIKTENGDLYVSFWYFNNWYIKAEIPMTLDAIKEGLENLLDKIKDIVD